MKNLELYFLILILIAMQTQVFYHGSDNNVGDNWEMPCLHETESSKSKHGSDVDLKQLCVFLIDCCCQPLGAGLVSV